MFPLKSLTRWWELRLNFADKSLDAYLPTNRRVTSKGETLQHRLTGAVLLFACFSSVAS